MLIPARTAELGKQINAKIVAAVPRDLFKWRPGSQSARLRPTLADPIAFRRHLRVSRNCGVIAVLNTRDDFLEAIWRSDRSAFYSALHNAGVSLITGPTFSIFDESNEHPAFHNVTVARRHHRAVQEMYDAGLTVAPNIYWRNEAALRNWVDYLRDAPVEIISRDFSLTKRGRQFDTHLDGLVRIVDMVGRPLQVVLVGIGAKKARISLERLSAVGGSCSFVNADAIMLAIKRAHQLRPIRDNGLEEIRELDVPKDDLAIGNLSALQDHLLAGIEPRRARMNSECRFSGEVGGTSAA